MAVIKLRSWELISMPVEAVTLSHITWGSPPVSSMRQDIKCIANNFSSCFKLFKEALWLFLLFSPSNLHGNQNILTFSAVPGITLFCFLTICENQGWDESSKSNSCDTLKKVNFVPKRLYLCNIIVQRVVNYFDQKEILLCTNNYL